MPESGVTQGSEPTFAPPTPDDGKPTGRGNEHELAGRKGGEAAGVPDTSGVVVNDTLAVTDGAAANAERVADDPSEAPEEDNRSPKRNPPGGQE